MLWLVRVFIRGYQLALRPIMEWLSGPSGCCRYVPGCSRYFLEACETHGVYRGGWLGLKRLGRCHPWGGQGFDPVPARPPGAEDRRAKTVVRGRLQISKAP